jgi:hypothetical protein
MSLPERIVEALLETDEVDPKAFVGARGDQMYDVWVQIDGDVDWWEFGGTFHNEQQGLLAHVVGLDSANLKDWASWDIKLTPADLEAINAQFPVDIDPEWPEGGDQNERAREDAVEKLKDERAEQKNANRKMPVYRWTDDAITDFSDRFEQIADHYEVPFEELTLGQKWAAIGQILGYDEMDSYPEKYTWEELNKYLQPRQDFRGMSRQQHSLPDAP